MINCFFMSHPADGILRLDGFFLKESNSPRANFDSIKGDDPLLYEVGQRAREDGKVTVNGHSNWIIDLVRYSAQLETKEGKVHSAKLIPFSEYHSLGRPLELA